jgi:hypothetical protein
MAVRVPTCAEEEWQEARRCTDREWAKVRLLGGWEEREIPRTSPAYGGRAAVKGGYTVLFTVGPHEGQWWLHVSVSHTWKPIDYETMTTVKRLFIGEDRRALQVFAAKKHHVNIHPNVFHLWCRIDAPDGIPEFGAEGTI